MDDTNDPDEDIFHDSFEEAPVEVFDSFTDSVENPSEGDPVTSNGMDIDDPMTTNDMNIDHDSNGTADTLKSDHESSSKFISPLYLKRKYTNDWSPKTIKRVRALLVQCLHDIRPHQHAVSDWPQPSLGIQKRREVIDAYVAISLDRL